MRVPVMSVVPEQLVVPSLHVQEADPLRSSPEIVRFMVAVVVPPSSGQLPVQEIWFPFTVPL